MEPACEDAGFGSASEGADIEGCLELSWMLEDVWRDSDVTWLYEDV
jgi:hypothetical protein